MTAGRVRARLLAAGLTLPPVSPPRSRYVPLRIHGGIAYCAGVTSDGITGLAGDGCTPERAAEAARLAALRQLAYLEEGLGSLDRVTEVLQLRGYVACVPGFPDTPAVVDAASAVHLTAFGDVHGRHARSAIGVAGLPGGALVELELLVAL